jgi:hypothetical protein
MERVEVFLDNIRSLPSPHRATGSTGSSEARIVHPPDSLRANRHNDTKAGTVKGEEPIR